MVRSFIPCVLSEPIGLHTVCENPAHGDVAHNLKTRPWNASGTSCFLFCGKTLFYWHRHYCTSTVLYIQTVQMFFSSIHPSIHVVHTLLLLSYTSTHLIGPVRLTAVPVLFRSQGEYVSCLLSLLRQMTDIHFQHLLDNFQSKEELKVNILNHKHTQTVSQMH